MYLLTFSFLVIGMIGIYTQVYALEVARLYQNQTSIGQAMIGWHEAAVSLAENVVKPAAFVPEGCSLTLNLFPTPSYCSIGSSITWSTEAQPPGVVVSPLVTYMSGSGTYPSNLFFSNYNTNPYTWYSVAFSNGSGGDYVITYAGSGSDGFAWTALSSLGITESDLYQQVKQTGIPLTGFGYVYSAGGNKTLVTPATLPLPSGDSAYTYQVPGTVPAGAFGIISAISACNGC